MNTPGTPEPEQQPQAVISEFSALVVLLGLFLLIGLIALFAIVLGGAKREHPEEVGRRAWGPADFADAIDWEASLHPDQAKWLAAAKNRQFPVPPPPFSEDIYPCSDCHDPEDTDFDREPRELDAHEEIVLQHGPEDRWCFDCHNPEDRDKLRLVNGGLIGFDESFRLCGQCHGTIFRDWRRGIHGRRAGYWDGPKVYLLCAHCHDPHSPRFRPLEPLPPPVRPNYLRESVKESE